MTREEILAMKPGRELDALVAERVMNLCVLDNVQQYGDGCVVSDKGFDLWMQHLEFGRVEDPDLLEPYSTDISAAWEVLEKMLEKGAEVNVGFYEKWDCAIDYPIDCNWRATAETAPEAICKAALIAVMEGKDEEC